MSAALGSLVVSLEANVARFTADMGKAAYQTEQAMKKMDRAAATVNAAVIGLAKGAASALSVNYFAGMIKGAIDSMDALNDLKDATGASIANISALEDVAVRTGANIDTVGTAMIKFQKVLMDAAPGSQAELGLTALGLSAQNLKNMDLAEAMLQYAKALDRFADDGNKARLVMEQTGKSVKELAPFLKDLAEQSELVGSVTAQDALEAEKFNKALFALQKSTQDIARDLAGPMVKSLNDVILKFQEGEKAGKGFLDVGLENYWTNVRKFWGMTPPESTAPEGSWSNAGGGRGIVNPEFVKPSIGYEAGKKTSSATAKPQKSEAEKIEEDAQRFVARLREQAETFGMSGAAVLEYQMSLSKFPQVYKDEALGLQKRIDAYKEAADQDKAFAAATERFMSDRERDIQANESNLARIRISLMSEAEQQQLAHELVLEELQTFHDAKFENVALANALIEEENARHQQVLTDMQAAHDLQSLGMMGNATDQLLGILQKSGKDQTALGKAVFLASKAIAVAEILINTEVAAAKAGAQLGIFGIPMAMMIRATGYASAGMVAGMAIADASAEGGYDIPSGTNPITQLHEREMVLPREHADVIRGLATNGGAGGGAMALTIVNQTSGRIDKVTEQRISPTERAIIIQEAVSATAAQFGDPNSKTSRAVSRNFALQRSR